jgi:hypothetical protein
VVPVDRDDAVFLAILLGGATVCVLWGVLAAAGAVRLWQLVM